MSTRSSHLSLELHSDGARIAGQLWDEHGDVWPFASWLGLITLIEQLRTSGRAPDDGAVNPSFRSP